MEKGCETCTLNQGGVCEHPGVDAEEECGWPDFRHWAGDNSSEIADLRQTLAQAQAAASLARDRIARAQARLMNRHTPDTEPMSPERQEWTDTIMLLVEAIALLAPDEVHPEDAQKYRDMIAAKVAA